MVELHSGSGWFYKYVNTAVPHLCVLAHRVVQVQIPSDDVQLDSQQNHQHAGAVNSHDGARET